MNNTVGRRGSGSSGDNGGGSASMFSDEELRDLSGLKIEKDYVEVTCGCTSHRYGDAGGRLRIFSCGDFEISCECTPGCQEDKLTPAAFEKHSGRETAKRWKNNIWVIVDGEKVPLYKTALLKYYDKSSKSINGARRRRSTARELCHRDEFLRCTRCNKDRRIHLRNKEECRFYHDSLSNPNWKCTNIPYEKVSCEDDEERVSRRVYRGCLRSAVCKGCTNCVCFGCEICRYSDCSCQTCSDFLKNAS